MLIANCIWHQANSICIQSRLRGGKHRIRQIVKIVFTMSRLHGGIKGDAPSLLANR